MADKSKKFSYSKLNNYESCPFKFHLQYEKNHFINAPSIASDFGSIVHFIYESIARSLQIGEKPDYEKLKNDFLNINIPKDPKDRSSGLLGVNELKKKYKADFFSVDEYGMSYHTKSEYFLNEGIYRLENFMKEHPTYEIYGMEQFFSISFGDYVLSGYMDRVFHDTATGKYIIDDIKTKSHAFKDTECITPLQFVLYTKALSSMTGADIDQIECYYDLPFCKMRQSAGTKGFVDRGMKKITEIFTKIESGDRTPNCSPLCFWCAFSPTNPNQPEDGKNLCPYYSLWTPSHKTYDVRNKWEGLEKHDIVLSRYLGNDKTEDYGFDFDF